MSLVISAETDYCTFKLSSATALRVLSVIIAGATTIGQLKSSLSNATVPLGLESNFNKTFVYRRCLNNDMLTRLLQEQLCFVNVGPAKL